MKKAFCLFIAVLIPIANVDAQELVVEYESDFNRAFRSELRQINSDNDLDFEEDGIREIVLIEEDDAGNQTKIIALDGRTHVKKWELNLTGLNSVNRQGINKFSRTHRDSIIWRGFRKIRKVVRLGKSTGNSERLAVFGGEEGGILIVDPHTNDVLLDKDDNFTLLAVFDIDGDGLDEVIVGDKPRRTVMIYGDGSVTSLESGEPSVPIGFHLAQNYPNPFNPATTIYISISQSDQVELKIYDLLGRLVRTLVGERRQAGKQSVVWDGRDNLGRAVASGQFFYQLTVGNTRTTRKMVLLK